MDSYSWVESANVGEPVFLSAAIKRPERTRLSGICMRPNGVRSSVSLIVFVLDG